MSYIIKYQRIRENDDETTIAKIYTELVSNIQYRIIRNIPWIKIIEARKSNKPSKCNSLR